MHGAFHPKSSTARLYTSRKKGGRGLHSIKNVVRQEEQSLESYVSGKAESDPLTAKCKRLIATWKKPDKAAALYEKPLHSAWHKGASEDMARTYQLLNKSNIRANTEIPGMISEVELQKSIFLRTAQILRRVLKLPGPW